MSRLFLANCTRQNQVVNYRLDFDRDGGELAPNSGRMYKYQPIPPGAQKNIGGDIHISAVHDIIDQLQRFGLVRVEDFRRGMKCGEIPYLASVDKPVSSLMMQQAFEHNRGVLVAEGLERRKSAAIAASTAVESPRFDVSFEQEGGDDPEGGSIAEGYTVTSDARVDGAPRRGRPRKNRDAQA